MFCRTGKQMGRHLPAHFSDITSYLAPVLASKDATEALRGGRTLLDAYEYSSGEEQLVLRALSRANRAVESALAVAHRHAVVEVQGEVKKLIDSVDRLWKTVEPKK